MSELIAAGLLLFAAAALVDVLPGRRAPYAVPYLLCAAGSGCLAAVGALALGRTGRAPRLDLGDTLGFGTAALRVDRLSGLFWLLTFAVAVAACLTAAGWASARRPGRGPAAYHALVLASVAVVESADNVFLFVMAWEGITLGFYLLTAAGHRRIGPAVATFGFGKVSGAALLLGLLTGTARTGDFSLAGLAELPAGTARSATWALLVLAFAVKTGLVPVQVWLPRGYAAAPAGLRPVLAGVAVNAGFYGLWRTFALLGPPPAWLAVTLLLLAALTAFLGIAHAAVQARLERVVAWSSIENAGLICTGYAVALVGALTGSERLTAAGLLAATLQTIAHAVAKTLLFAGAAAVESDAGTGDLEQLRGTARRLPWAAGGLAAGAVTLAGLPPTAGFVSEWFLLESLMQQFRYSAFPYGLALAVAGALIALTAGFASVTFVRIVGMVVLGPRDDRPARRAPCRADLGIAGRAGVLLLALGGLAAAALTPLQLRVISAGLEPLVPRDATLGALVSPWVVQPVFAGFSSLSPSWLWVVMPVLCAGVLVLLVAASRGGALRVRRVPAWRSASGGVHGDDRYTPFGYANPTRRVLGAVLRTRTRATPTGIAPAVAARPGTGDPPAPEPEGEPGPEGAGPVRTAATGGTLDYASDVVEVVEVYLYQPFYRPLRALVAAAKRLQCGRLDAYLTYMLIVLVGALALVAALS
ncbi:proton-conducting transporter transmembrane domain-containing protein [Streptomyces sp. SAT1]|uniref:proton-conducting transporter transmembrane domain-containing protein n=1 Tax=Streptomyces sp. SAT1 TaxID=1849967 RepID=UPI000AE14365|nr:proton-conducting transporter membrane subunit [Streptomyces sp. SAT1]